MNHIFIKCAFFNDLTSNDNGTIVHAANGNLTYLNNIAIGVRSTSFPGCIFCDHSLLHMKNNNFEYCHSSGNDQCWGNVMHCVSCDSVIESFSAFKSSYSTSITGDSLILLQSSKLSSSFFNSSFCYGGYGG